MRGQLIFRIGEFSKVAQVSGRLLRYYEKIGLFQPTYSDPETGTRYYSARQLPRLNRILALKGLGFTLDQVAQLLDNVSEDELRGMLKIRKAQIEQAVDDELIRLHAIEARIQGIHSHDPDVVVKSIPAQRFLSVRQKYPSLVSAQQHSSTMRDALSTEVRARLGYFTVVLHSDSYEDDDIDIEMGFVVNRGSDDHVVLPDAPVMSVKELPAVTAMATVVRVGRIDRAHLGYGALGQWVEANAYELAGAAREMYLQPPTPGIPDETVVEIQVPVTRQ